MLTTEKVLQLAIILPNHKLLFQRAFDAFRHLHNWLRNSMLQERLTDLAVPHMDKSLLKTV